MSKLLPDLDVILPKCYQLGDNLNTKQTAEVFCAAIAFLGHLKAERDHLRVSMADNDTAKDILPSKIPAMSATVQDDRLFQALLRCLQPVGSNEARSTSQLDHHFVGGGRKRSLSVSAEPPSKQMKLANGMRRPNAEHTQPSLFLPGLACTILSTALAHLDHWPAPLVEVYAQDSFNQRQWVDHIQCKCLVDNLVLSHTATIDGDNEVVLEVAALVADAYRGYEFGMRHKNPEAVDSPKRRSSWSSVSSFVPPSHSAPDDSDSGGEEHVGKLATGGDDSSSGEDEELIGDSRVLTHSPPTPNLERGKLGRNSVGRYPLHETKVSNWSRVRQRFFGHNRDLVYDIVGKVLAVRLSVKSKQNSGLLGSLPAFTTIPSVRKHVASQLERWLQSPALAGLARHLFSCTVQCLDGSQDPPLVDDLETIDMVLRMKLKANQLNAHIENIRAIAAKVPNGIVINRMYMQLLRDASDSLRQEMALSKNPSTQFTMISSIHSQVPAQLSYDAIAASLLSILVEADDKERQQREKTVGVLRRMIRSIATQLKGAFDARALMKALLSFDVESKSWSIRDEEDKGRLLFQCATLYVRSIAGESEAQVKAQLSRIRILFLQWCCGEYGSRCRTKLEKKHEQQKIKEEKVGFLKDAGIPDYGSILHKKDIKIPTWLRVVRCVLFIEDSGSALARQFVCPGTTPEDEEDWKNEMELIDLCSKLGVDVDDEMIWIIVRSCIMPVAGLSNEMAIQLVEHMVSCCTAGRKGTMKVSDPTLLWELYSLSEYQPLSSPPQDVDGHQEASLGNAGSSAIPKLAYPGLWWRTNVLALIFCVASPCKIGKTMWEENPTIRALLKMVTSQHFQFPTIDCSADQRQLMKANEKDAREQEMQLAEQLFLPKRESQPRLTQKNVGSRVSKRILKQRRERAAAEERAETKKRRELLRAGQRSIMLWNPDGPARKPPKELGDALLAVEEAFKMGRILRLSRSPDFVLRTIGETTRGAIERAHGWLVPVISELPETIERLPSNATCFLLLRSYGNHRYGETKLESLSAPLLKHVKDSLCGRFGESNAVEALDLLLGDLACRNESRRRCASRVLNSTLTKDSDDVSSWIEGILEVEHAKSMTPCTIKYMSISASLERGAALECLLLGLNRHISFAQSQQISVEHSSFPKLFLQLMSERPGVYAELLEQSQEMKKLASETIHSEFKRHVNEKSDSTSLVAIKLPATVASEEKMQLPLTLLHSICILLAVWHSQLEDKTNAATRGIIKELADSLLLPDQDVLGSGPETGLGTASSTENIDDLLIKSVRLVVSDSLHPLTSHQWVMLSKAKDTTIARRAALSVPLKFIARMILGTGLPKAAFETMMKRLDQLSADLKESDEKFGSTFIAAFPRLGEWDVGRVGSRKDLDKKLLMRLKAYCRLHGLKREDLNFLTMIEAELQEEKKESAKAAKKRKTKPPKHLSCLDSASEILSMVGNSTSAGTSSSIPVDTGAKTERFLAVREKTKTAKDFDGVLCHFRFQSRLLPLVEDKLGGLTETEMVDAAENLSRAFVSASSSIPGGLHVRFIEKWIPRLSNAAGSEELWDALFSSNLVGGGRNRERATLDRIILRCATSWDRGQVNSCLAWLIKACGDSKICAHRTRLFLTSVSGFSGVELGVNSFRFDAADTSNSTKMMALLLSDYGVRGRRKTPDDVTDLRAHLFEQVAACGKNHMQACIETIRIAAAEKRGNEVDLQTLLLRLYIASPLFMNLGSPMIRNGLIAASQHNVALWSSWQSSLDCQVDGILDGMFHGEAKLTRTLSEFTRKHPLLLFRKTLQIVARLEEDASPLLLTRERKRGLVVGSISLPATESGKDLRIRVTHWGCIFTESAWVGLLDVLSVVPRELLLGPNLGLFDILDVFVNLVSVQMHLSSFEKTSRLRAKLESCFGAIKQSPSSWNQWLEKEVHGTKMRNFLVSCNLLSPQEAINSL